MEAVPAGVAQAGVAATEVWAAEAAGGPGVAVAVPAAASAEVAAAKVAVPAAASAGLAASLAGAAPT